MNAGDDLLVKLVGFLIKSVGFLWMIPVDSSL